MTLGGNAQSERGPEARPDLCCGCVVCKCNTHPTHGRPSAVRWHTCLSQVPPGRLDVVFFFFFCFLLGDTRKRRESFGTDVRAVMRVARRRCSITTSRCNAVGLARVFSIPSCWLGNTSHCLTDACNGGTCWMHLPVVR